jgi:hypothetical protein
VSVEFKDLVGKTLTRVEVVNDKTEVHIDTEDGKKYVMYHCQDCCEYVSVDDVCGELDWLIGSPIISAEESSNSDENPDGLDNNGDESWTWTFYRIATAKGLVVIRWYGSSNGYYSEDVYFSERT